MVRIQDIFDWWSGIRKSELTIDAGQEIGDITGTAHFEPIRYPLSIHWRLHPQLASYSDFHRILFCSRMWKRKMPTSWRVRQVPGTTYFRSPKPVKPC